MQARYRIWAASYGPETIKAMLAAFDEAWAAVCFHFHESPESFETARARLADAILAAAAEDNRDVGRLKNAGLMAMAMHYRLQPTDFGLEAIMPQRVNNPKYWRSHAEESRTIAEQMKDPECRRILMDIAEMYAELGRRAVALEAGNKIAGVDPEPT